MRVFDSLEDFLLEFNISLLLGLYFVKDGAVDLVASNPIEGELFLPKS